MNTLSDLDGNRVALVPHGYLGLSWIGYSLRCSRCPRASAVLHTQALGSCGRSDRSATGERSWWANGADCRRLRPTPRHDAAFEGKGWRYITFQVFEVDQEHANAAGEALAPETLGSVARVSMVRDPDGNWIELSERASLTGSLD